MKRLERLQSLWGGYGELWRVAHASGATAIAKTVRPPADAPRDAGFARKLQSYAVERAFYAGPSSRCDHACRVPALLATDADTLVLEDLDAAGFDGRTDETSSEQLDACLAWLASFHARFLGERFDALWPIGTYWHLATRMDELPAISDPHLRAAAPRIDEILRGAHHTTLLHGDAKDANFCFASGPRVAAVDFQYTGPGPGIIDVAYLLYGRSDEPADGIDRARLDAYFTHLRHALGRRVDCDDIDAIEAEWRDLYITARLDFCRFLAGWRPALWARDHRGQRFVRAQLIS